MYEISVTTRAQKDFDNLEKDVQERVVKIFERIKLEPFRHLKKLADKNFYRLRVGDYRAIISVEKNVLMVLKIAHRKNVYQEL